MKPDEVGYQEWHEAVRPFRNTARVLMEPVPERFVDLLSMQALVSSLMPELPLLNFSPFDALPDDLPEPDRGQASTASGATRPVLTRAPQEVSKSSSSVGSPMFQPSSPQRHGSPMPSPQSSTSVTQAPVFSLRQHGGPATDRDKSSVSAPEQRSPSDRGAEPTSQETSGEGRRPSLGAFTTASRLQRTELDEAPRQPQTQANNQRDLPGPAVTYSVPTDAPETQPATTAPRSYDPETSPPLAASLPPMALLARLTDALLQKTGHRAPHRTSGTPPNRGASPQSAPPHLRSSASSLPGQNDRPTSGSSSPPGRVPAAYDGISAERAVKLMDSFAEHLLGPRRRSVGQGTLFDGDAAEGVVASVPWRVTVPGNPPLTPDRQTAVGSADSGMQPTSPGPRRSGQAPFEATAASHSLVGQPLDTDRLAALINEILIEQARRHGVDLS